MTKVETAVIGAGLTGLSAAYHLLNESPGRDVVVLEAQQIGAGASGRSTGMLTPGIGQNLNSLIKRYGPKVSRSLYEETIDAVHYAKNLIRKLDIECQLRMNGQLITSPKHQSMQGRLVAQLRAYEKLELPHQTWDLQKLTKCAGFAVSPDSVSNMLPAAIRLPDAGTLHPSKLVNGLADHIEKSGGVIYERSEVVSISAGQPASLHFKNGAILSADNVVVATSGYGASLQILNGRVLPMHLGIVATKPLTPTQIAKLHWPGRECVIDCRRLFNYFRLTEDNRIVFGGGLPRYRWRGNTAQLGTAAKDLGTLANELKYVFSDLTDLEVAEAWTGVIGYSMDTMPTIYKLPKQPAVLYVGAWSGHGIALSIKSGSWVKQLIDDRRPPSDLPWFNHSPPLLPSEVMRWCGAKCVIRGMRMLDHYFPDSKPSLSSHGVIQKKADVLIKEKKP